MRKIILVMVASFLLVGCGSNTEQSSKPTDKEAVTAKELNTNEENEEEAEVHEVVIENISVGDVQQFADKEVERLTAMLDPQKMAGSRTPGDYPTEVATKINIIPDEYPEILLLDQTNGLSVIEVFRYDTNEDGWISIYRNDKHVNYDGLESLMYLGYGQFGADNKQSPAFGIWAGSSGFFNFQFLSGDDTGKVTISLDKMAGNYLAGDIVIEDKVENKIHIISEGKVVETFTPEDLK